MDVLEQTELVIREAAATVLFADLLPRLYRAGWSVFADGGRSLYAMKGAGRIYLPGGVGGRWNTRVAELDGTLPTEPAATLTPSEMNERAVWRVDLDQAAPTDLILTVAERAAGEP